MVLKKDINIVGRKFGNLLVLSFNDNDNYLCKCCCGKEIILSEKDICRNRANNSCGCKAAHKPKRNYKNFGNILTEEYLEDQYSNKNMEIKQISKNIDCSIGCVKFYLKKYQIVVNNIFRNIKNKKFDKMKVISLHEIKNNNYFYLCKCDCGNEKVVESSLLVKNIVYSCGCCLNPSTKIRSWQKIISYSFARNIEFNISVKYAWDLFEKQDKKCALSGVPIHFLKNKTASLDRIDSMLGYVEGNVQWLHKKVNSIKMTLSKNELLKICADVMKMNGSNE